MKTQGEIEDHHLTAKLLQPELPSSSQSSAASNPFGQPFRMQIHTSKRLLTFIVATHVIAFLIVFALAWPWWVSVLMGGLVLLSGWHQWCNHHFNNGMELMYSDQRWHTMMNSIKTEWHLFGEYYVSSWMIVLRFKTDGAPKKLTLVLLSDSADQQQLRRLRVLLRLGVR